MLVFVVKQPNVSHIDESSNNLSQSPNVFPSSFRNLSRNDRFYSLSIELIDRRVGRTMVHRFHIGRDGNPHECHAEVGRCPLGGQHYSTMAEAEAASESRFESKSSPSLSKTGSVSTETTGSNNESNSWSGDTALIKAVDKMSDKADRDFIINDSFMYTYGTAKSAFESMKSHDGVYDDDSMNTLRDIAAGDAGYDWTMRSKRKAWRKFNERIGLNRRTNAKPPVEMPIVKDVDLRIDSYGRPVIMVGVRRDESPLKLSDKGRGSFFNSIKNSAKKDGFKGNEAVIVVYNYDNPTQYNYSSMGRKKSSSPLDDGFVEDKILKL